MGPLPPIGPYRGMQPFESVSSGVPKARGPQGQENRGDAGKKKGLPKLSIPGMAQERKPPPLQNVPSITPPLPVGEKPSSEPSPTVAGFFKNAAADISEFAMAPILMARAAWEAGYDIVKNVKYADALFTHPELVTRELDNTWKGVIQSIVEPYKDGLGMAAYKHPFTVLLDATMVFDVLGGGIKAAGKASVRAAGKTGLEAVKAMAQNPMVRLGDSIQTMPGRMFAAPLKWAGKGLLKIPAVGTAASKFGLDAAGMETAKIIGAHKQHQRALTAPHVETLFKSKIPKKDWELYDDIVNGVLPESHALSPAMKERTSYWRGWNQEFEHTMTDLGIREKEALERAILGQTAIKLEGKGYLKSPLHDVVEGKVGISDAAIEEARAWRGGANPFNEATNPVYRPWTHERSFNVSEFIDTLQQGEGSRAYLQFNSRMEGRTGAKAVSLDPDFWTARSAFQRSEALGAVSAFQDVLRKYGKPVKGGKALPGHVIVPPIFRKYTGEGLVNAVDLLTQKLKEKEALARLSGEDRAKAVVLGIKETRDELMAQAREIQANLVEAVEKGNFMVQIPEGSAYVLQKSFLGPRGFWRFYDNVLDTWRDMLLTLMPRYYINNLLGNAILLTFAGHNPATKVAALKRGDLPGEALGSMYAAEGGQAGSFLARPFEAQQRPVRRFANRLSDLTDNTAKQVALGGFAKEVIEQQAMVENLAAQGLASLETMQEAVDIIAQARRKMLDTPLEELSRTKRIFSGADEAWQHRQGILTGEVEELQKQMQSLASQGGDASQIKLIQNQIGAREEAMKHVSRSDARLAALGVKDVGRIPLTKTSRDLAQAGLAEMRQIQHSMSTVRSLSRLDPPKGQRQLAELRAQLERKAKELESIDPNILIDRLPDFKKSPDLMELAEVKLRQATLAPYAGLMEQSVRQMENWFGNYGRLHPLGRDVIRRVIPFWTFTSTMFRLMYQLPFIRPKTSFLFNRAAKFVLDGLGEDLPDRLKYSIPLGGDENGYIMFLNLRGINPLDTAARWSSVGGVPLPKTIDPTNNPLIKMAVETVGGYDTFIEKPFTKKTDFVALDGRVLRYDPDTRKIEQVIPQKPLLRAIYEQIPYMKMVDEVMVGTGLVDEGMMGTPSGRGPDGSVLYNRHWLQGISRWLGAPTTTQNPERIRMQQQLQKRSMYSRYRALAGRSDPETRVDVERLLQDLELAEFQQ